METITARSDIDGLFKHGRRASTMVVSVLAVRTPEARDQGGRVLFVAGKKLGGAVVRNRLKRVLRESTRRCHGPWPGWDVALLAKRGALGATPAQLDTALDAVLRKVGVIA